MKVPPYFDQILEGFAHGATGRYVHLGCWPEGPDGALALDADLHAAQHRLSELLLSLADLHDGQQVLDVGCGLGGSLQAINLRHHRMGLTGVNIDPRQLAVCRQIAALNGNRLSWVEADACRLPQESGSQDRVLCIEAMFHFSSRRRFIAEAARVLRPGGRLVLSDIVFSTEAAAQGVPGFCIEAALQDGYGPWPDFWCADADHAALAHDAGMHVAHQIDLTRQTWPTHHFTVSSSADDLHDSGDVSQRAAQMLRWMHARGFMSYPCMVLVKH